MHRIVKVEPLDGYRLRLRFEDGIEGDVDLSDLVGQGVFASWKDYRRFLKVSLDPETHTVAWPGGIDLCPDALHEEAMASMCVHDEARQTPKPTPESDSE